MSLRAPLVSVIPEATARVARAAFPNGNPYLLLRDTLGPISTHPDFVARFPSRGQPALAPAQLAWVTIMQFAADLSDRQAADDMPPDMSSGGCVRIASTRGRFGCKPRRSPRSRSFRSCAKPR